MIRKISDLNVTSKPSFNPNNPWVDVRNNNVYTTNGTINLYERSNGRFNVASMNATTVNYADSNITLTSSSDFTIGGYWYFDPNDNRTYNPIFTQRKDWNTLDFEFYYRNDLKKMRWWSSPQAGDQIEIPVTFNKGNWIHILVSYRVSDKKINFYYNGLKVYSTNLTNDFTGQSTLKLFLLGEDILQTTYVFKGMASDFFISNDFIDDDYINVLNKKSDSDSVLDLLGSPLFLIDYNLYNKNLVSLNNSVTTHGSPTLNNPNQFGSNDSSLDSTNGWYTYSYNNKTLPNDEVTVIGIVKPSFDSSTDDWIFYWGVNNRVCGIGFDNRTGYNSFHGFIGSSSTNRIYLTGDGTYRYNTVGWYVILLTARKSDNTVSLWILTPEGNIDKLKSLSYTSILDYTTEDYSVGSYNGASTGYSFHGLTSFVGLFPKGLEDNEVKSVLKYFRSRVYGRDVLKLKIK